MSFVLARSVWLAMLGALATIPGGKLFGAAPKMQPFTNDINPGPDSVVTDFTAPTYTGYGDATVSLAGPFVNAQGNCFEIVNDVTFTVTTDGESTQLFGFILKDSVLGYLGGVHFDSPITISGPSGAVQLGQDVQIDPGTGMGPPDVD